MDWRPLLYGALLGAARWGAADAAGDGEIFATELIGRDIGAEVVDFACDDGLYVQSAFTLRDNFSNQIIAFGAKCYCPGTGTACGPTYYVAPEEDILPVQATAAHFSGANTVYSSMGYPATTWYVGFDSQEADGEAEEVGGALKYLWTTSPQGTYHIGGNAYDVPGYKATDDVQTLQCGGTGIKGFRIRLADGTFHHGDPPVVGSTRIVAAVGLLCERAVRPGGTVLGHPRFTGFDGSSYTYAGSPGAAFSVLSTPSLQVNAMLAGQQVYGLTQIAALGVTTIEGMRLSLSVGAGDGALTAVANNARVLPGEALTGTLGLWMRWVDGDDVEVAGHGVTLRVRVHKGRSLDLASVSLSEPPPPAIHGVLGRSALPRGPRPVADAAADYAVSGLFASDSAFSAFAARDVAVGDARLRGPSRADGPRAPDATGEGSRGPGSVLSEVPYDL